MTTLPRILHIAAEQSRQPVSPQSTLDGLALDSFDIMEMCWQIETDFDIDFEQDLLTINDTLQQVALVIDQEIARQK